MFCGQSLLVPVVILQAFYWFFKVVKNHKLLLFCSEDFLKDHLQGRLCFYHVLVGFFVIY